MKPEFVYASIKRICDSEDRKVPYPLSVEYIKSVLNGDSVYEIDGQKYTGDTLWEIHWNHKIKVIAGE